MNLRLIKNAEHVEHSELLAKDIILETVYENSRYPDIKKIRYYIYNVATNERYEILPKVHKLNIFKIRDTSLERKYLYITQYNPREDIFQIVRYDWQIQKAGLLYRFEEPIDHFFSEKRLSIFVLNENNLLLQTESLRRNMSDNYEGYFDFSLTLYNRTENKHYEVVDDNLVRNGITELIPVTDTVCVIKTGYSLFEDDRYTVLDKMEVSVESVCLVNVQQLVSDLIIGQNGIVMDSLDQTYYKQTIPYVRVEDGYVIYSKIDNENNEENVIFYHAASKKILSCINRGVVNTERMANPMIIKHKPYIRMNRTKKTDFLNLHTKQVELSFPNEQKVQNVLDDVFIISESKKGMFGREKVYMSVYKYPSMTILHSEKCTYENALLKDDILYIFIS